MRRGGGGNLSGHTTICNGMRLWPEGFGDVAKYGSRWIVRICYSNRLRGLEKKKKKKKKKDEDGLVMGRPLIGYEVSSNVGSVIACTVGLMTMKSEKIIDGGGGGCAVLPRFRLHESGSNIRKRRWSCRTTLERGG